MKRLCEAVSCSFAALLLLLACFAAPGLAEMAREAGVKPEALYRGTAQKAITVRAAMDAEAEPLGRIERGAYVRILSYEPQWLEVVVDTKDGGWYTGYAPRASVDEVVTLQQGILPYGTTPSAYTAIMDRDAPLLAAPNADARLLFMLPEGGRIAILSIEDGWAKVIYWRQYAYFYMDAVRELTPVYPVARAGEGDTIAAFITFFTVNSEEMTQNRIVNINQACEYISIEIPPRKQFAFDSVAGPYRVSRGYLQGISYFEGRAVPSLGGGVCQVSSTLYNVLLALPDGMAIEHRRAHGPSGATYLPHGVDAAVGNATLNLIFRNRFSFSVRIEAEATEGLLFISMVKGRENE